MNLSPASDRSSTPHSGSSTSSGDLDKTVIRFNPPVPGSPGFRPDIPVVVDNAFRQVVKGRLKKEIPSQPTTTRTLPTFRAEKIIKQTMKAHPTTLKANAIRIAAWAVAVFATLTILLDLPGKLIQYTLKRIGHPVAYDGVSDKLFRSVSYLRTQATKIEGSAALGKAFGNASQAAKHFNDGQELGKKADRQRATQKPPISHTQLASELSRTDPATAAFVLASGEIERTSNVLPEPGSKVLPGLERAHFGTGNPVTLSVVPSQVESHTTKKGLHRSVVLTKKLKKTFKGAALQTMNARQALRGLPELGPRDQPWNCYAFTSETPLSLPAARQGSLCPTSSRTEFEVAGLHNAYLNVVELPGGYRQMNITTGVINTKAKADAFVAIILQARADHRLERQPLRIGMHQLNSFNTESDLIENEHAMAYYIQARLQETDPSIIISHENTSFNAATNTYLVPTKKLPLLINENAHCNNMNLDAAAMSVLMLQQDFRDSSVLNQERIGSLRAALDEIHSAYVQAISYDPQDYPQLSSLEKQIQELQRALAELIADPHSKSKYPDPLFHEKKSRFEADIQTLLQTKVLAEEKIISRRISAMSAPNSARATLSGQLTQIYSELASEIEKINRQLNLQLLSTTATTVDKAALQQRYAQLTSVWFKIGVACGKITKSQSVKVLMQHLADISFGMVSQANCKSGLDRTGMARAMIASVDGMIRDGFSIDKVIIFIMHIDKHVDDLNKAIDAQTTKTTSAQELKELVLTFSPQLQWAFKFQMNNFAHLIDVGLPITARSTGLEGLKWHHEKKGLDANPHPGPMLPRFVLGSDGTTLQRLVGTDNLLSSYGVKVFSGASALRGA